MNDTVKIAKINLEAKKSETFQRAAIEALKNPIIEFAVGMLLIAVLEDLEIHKGSGNHVLEGPEALVARAWVASMIMFQQVAPALPYTADMVKSLAPLIPLLAA